MEDVIWLGDCVKVLGSLPAGSVDLVATDPPFNIGLKYDLYDDKKDYKAYVQWCREWLTECNRVLAPNGSIFVCIGDEYVAEINIILKELGFRFRNWLIWYYTFGENQKKKFNRCHTHILYFTKGDEFKFYPDAIKVPSKRQLMGDKRAKAGGKLPDDVWENSVFPEAAPSALPNDVWDGCVDEDVADVPMVQRLGEALGVPDDVWKISRVCGTFKERVKAEDGSAHPCQMPSSVMERIIKSCTVAGDLVVDPFCGTGTTAVVAKGLGRRFITMDISKDYASVAAERIFGSKSAYKTHDILISGS